MSDWAPAVFVGVVGLLVLAGVLGLAFLGREKSFTTVCAEHGMKYLPGRVDEPICRDKEGRLWSFDQ
jgi:hypothetical protein